MEVGKAYLVFSGDAHVWVGRCTETPHPFLAYFESVSKIKNTNNGDVWHELADGSKELRKACSYAHSKTGKHPIPNTCGALEWQGKTPQEEGL